MRRFEADFLATVPAHTGRPDTPPPPLSQRASRRHADCALDLILKHFDDKPRLLAKRIHLISGRFPGIGWEKLADEIRDNAICETFNKLLRRADYAPGDRARELFDRADRLYSWIESR